MEIMMGIQDSGNQRTRRFHFISGLPRSGSTLLAALLRQNPRFHAAMSSPVSGLVCNILHGMSGQNEFSVFLDDAKRRRIVQGVVENYYDDCQAEVVFDTSRSWCAAIDLLSNLFPGAKIIACVRDIPSVIESLERIIRRNVFQPSAIFDYRVDGTIYRRAEGLTANDGMIGAAYNALKEACYGEYAGSLLLIQYETLASQPARVMEAVYSFINEPAFAHDFEHVEYQANDYDAKIGTPGLHEVRPAVGLVERSTILPPDLVERYGGGEFWKVPTLNTRMVTVI
jgi:sulfotransferase